MEPSNEQNPQQISNPPEVPPPNVASKQNWLLLLRSNPMIVVLVLAIVLMIGGIAFILWVRSNQPSIATFEKEGQAVTVADISKTPNTYNGKLLIFTCIVSGFPKDNNGNVVGLNCSDPNGFGSTVQISIGRHTDITKINQNDMIKEYGLGNGALQGQNAFGVTILTGSILDYFLDDLTTRYKNY